MRETFTSGSVGRALGNQCLYPAETGVKRAGGTHPQHTLDERWRGRGARLAARPAPPRQRWGARASDQDARLALTLRVQRLPKRFERRAGDRLPQQPMQSLTVLYELDNGRNVMRCLSKMRRDSFEDHRPRLLHLPLL